MSKNRIFVSVFFLACFSVFPGTAFAANPVGVFFEPLIGIGHVKISTLEIDTTFIKAVAPEDGTSGIPREPTEIDPASVQAPVGRKTRYEGTGVLTGASLGLKIDSISFGVSYGFTSAEIGGYSKRYNYYPEKMRAGGRKFNDEGRVGFHQVMGLVRYGLPIWKFEFEFISRVGGVFIDDGPLILGRAVSVKKGFTVDLGVGLIYKFHRHFTAGIAGNFGLFTFSGSYEGAYGLLSGASFNVAFVL